MFGWIKTLFRWLKNLFHRDGESENVINEQLVRFIFSNDLVSDPYVFAKVRLPKKAIGYIVYERKNESSLSCKRYYIGRIVSLVELGFSLDAIEILSKFELTKAVRCHNGKTILLKRTDIIVGGWQC